MSGEFVRAIENPFSSRVPVPAEIDTKLARTIEGFKGLGEMFADSMREGLMPIDVAETDIPNQVTHDANGFTVIATRLPVWIVLQGTNLTGNNLFSGTVGNAIGGFREVHSPEEYTKAVDETDEDVDYAFASEKLLGVSGLGKLVLLTKRSEYYSYRDGSAVLPDFPSVATRALLPSDIFDISTTETSEALVNKFQVRLEEAIDVYRQMLMKEKSTMQPGQPLERPVDYYLQAPRVAFHDPRDIPKPKKVTKERGLLDKILGR